MTGSRQADVVDAVQRVVDAAEQVGRVQAETGRRSQGAVAAETEAIRRLYDALAPMFREDTRAVMTPRMRRRALYRVHILRGPVRWCDGPAD